MAEVIGDMARPESRTITVRRPVYSQMQFDEEYKERSPKAKPAGIRSRLYRQLVVWWRQKFAFISVRELKSCRLRDLAADIVSGITVGLVHVYQGLMFGIAANLAPVYGLYTALFPTFIYSVLGTTTHLSLGGFILTSHLVGDAVRGYETTACRFPANQTSQHELDTEHAQCKLAIATTLTFITGIIQLSMGLMRASILSTYLSNPLTEGFTSAVVIHVVIGHLPNAFGYRHHTNFTGYFQLIYSFVDVLRNIPGVNMADMITCLLCIVILALCHAFVAPWIKTKTNFYLPSSVILLVSMTALCYFTSIESSLSLTIVGDIPSKIPDITLPHLGFFPRLFGDALSIALISFVTNISLIRLLGKSQLRPVCVNQELIAYGMANIGGSLFSSHASAVDLSRSLLHQSQGGATKIGSLIACSVVLLTLLFGGVFIRHMPYAVLVAVIFTSLHDVFRKFHDLKKLHNFSN